MNKGLQTKPGGSCYSRPVGCGWNAGRGSELWLQEGAVLTSVVQDPC